MNNHARSEEEILIQSIESGEWHSVDSLSSEIKRYQNYAQAQSETEIKVTLSLSEVHQLQATAEQLETSVSELIAQAVRRYLHVDTVVRDPAISD
ncbi:ribbon-helix-helix protein, CopG family [Synechococcus elongatus]|uniref:Ribbon-helix-helix protein CopG domain-containing protein n=1 Tax=Synechococcus elongatus (strain ATCC 33912 / PCC 7942 / FACHB-805) TaxID=1140 RepID=Q31R78_SYNE7|nr:ribbon-helix-helix protein, CopG family [Synechococcus elongatus]ABB56441.1 hypothetical protein Synpcc7942_0409 [Synechococcus elongatus PCC 7942 = FACHB-805]AJD56513.1 hypothetical protein M744_00930 [Synechococcus elongatus UTEX 2973]MBD2588278.1 ribbon-helix-helix protein, CopG family [Synechococcus elongatus FACHB-242]MBD2689346.1 ribbon-helix-helix protein, CopG family [Synechococcus elongatus FACHB-1061]MBD2707014.1 ribbon-helix-helix protein, CopG family [Synechococcus elongatus PCC